MKTLTTKKNVLLISFFGILFIWLLFILDTHACYINEICKNIRHFLNQDIFAVIFVAPVIFLLSLITYRMKEEVFRAWWNFAFWFAPIIIVFQYIFMNSGGGGYIGNNDFAIFFTSLFYIAFILVSIIKIVRAYRR